jgi:hypothetical protein
VCVCMCVCVCVCVSVCLCAPDSADTAVKDKGKLKYVGNASGSVCVNEETQPLDILSR